MPLKAKTHTNNNRLALKTHQLPGWTLSWSSMMWWSSTLRVPPISKGMPLSNWEWGRKPLTSTIHTRSSFRMLEALKVLVSKREQVRLPSTQHLRAPYRLTSTTINQRNQLPALPITLKRLNIQILPSIITTNQLVIYKVALKIGGVAMAIIHRATTSLQWVGPLSTRAWSARPS